jgi:hypothetical protein
VWCRGGLCRVRSVLFRNKTKKALAAVRWIFNDGRINLQQKRKLIYSIIHSTSQDEISQVRRPAFSRTHLLPATLVDIASW